MADIHISGLISGTDYSSIISQMVALRSKPIETKEKEITELQADVAAWSDISSLATTLTDSLYTLKSSALWDSMTATSSNEAKLTATAGSSASTGVYTISISQLAQAHSVRSTMILKQPTFYDQGSSTTGSAATSIIGSGSSVTPSIWRATFDGTNWTVVNLSTGETAGVISGSTGSINLENDTGNGFAFTINAPTSGSYDAGDYFQWNNAQGSTQDLTATGLGLINAGDTFTIEGQIITIEAGETLSSLAGKINTAASSMSSADKVTASIVNNQLVITRNNTGASEIDMVDGTGSPLAALDILVGGTYQHELVAAQNAVFTVNSVSMTRSSNIVTDAITGVTLNLLDTTTSNVTLTVDHDRENVKTAITDFIDAYNALASALKEYGKIDIAGSSSNPKGASVDQSTLGELYNDSLVKELAYNIRKQATDSKYPYIRPFDYNPPTYYGINSTYSYNGSTGRMDTLQAIGIWTTGEDNQLALVDGSVEDNGARLDYMLENYFDQAEQLFRGVYDEEEGYQHGIASDFYEYMDSMSASMTGGIATHVQNLNDKIDELDDSIDQMYDDLKDYEQTLWEQFTAMEDAVAKMKSDLAYLGQIQK